MAIETFSDHDDPDNADNLNEHVFEPGDPDGVVAAEERQHWRETHPNPSSTPRPKPKRRLRLLTAAIVVVFIAAAAYGSFWLGTHEANKKQTKKSAQSTASTTSQKPNVSTTQTQTKQYQSTNFGLSFAYPLDWTVTESTAKLTVTSPVLSLVTAVGAKASVHVVLTIQNQASSIAGFPAGGAVASLESDKLSYSQPSTVQRAQTYVSYLSYTETSGLDAVYVTGDNGYQQSQQVPMSDIVKGNPLISVGFESCQNDTCTTGTTDPVTLQASSWKTSPAGKDINSMIESLVING
jgi:hypothetical protein